MCVLSVTLIRSDEAESQCVRFLTVSFFSNSSFLLLLLLLYFLFYFFNFVTEWVEEMGRILTYRLLLDGGMLSELVNKLVLDAQSTF